MAEHSKDGINLQQEIMPTIIKIYDSSLDHETFLKNAKEHPEWIEVLARNVVGNRISHTVSMNELNEIIIEVQNP